MEQRDQELLDKQLRKFNPPLQNDGVMVTAILAVFIVGMTFGGLIAYESEPIQIASNDAGHAISLPYSAPVIRQ